MYLLMFSTESWRMQNPRANYKITEIVNLHALLRIIGSINLNILSQKDQLSQVVMVFLN